MNSHVIHDLLAVRDEALSARDEARRRAERAEAEVQHLRAVIRKAHGCLDDITEVFAHGHEWPGEPDFLVRANSLYRELDDLVDEYPARDAQVQADRKI